MNENYKYPSKNLMSRLKQEMKSRRFSDKTVQICLYYITKILSYTSKKQRNIKVMPYKFIF